MFQGPTPSSSSGLQYRFTKLTMKTASVSDALAYLKQLKWLSAPGDDFTDLLNLLIH
jgi:hypothetical protein